MIDVLRTLKTALTRALEWIVIFAVAALVVDVLWGVCSRFVLQSPSRWTEEVATILLIWVSLLGAAVAFGRREHLGLDYVVNQLDPAAQQMAAIFVQVVVIGFAAAVLVGGGYVLVHETLMAEQFTPALGILKGYVYLAVPISGVFIILFSLEQIVELATGRDKANKEAE